MEASAPVQTSQSAMARTPEGLRQRQRDRLSPRGRLGKKSRLSASHRDIENSPLTGGALAPASPPKATGTRSPELIKKRQMQEGLRKENSVNRRAKREAEDAKHDIAPDGSSAGREGRQFTVANVGNNGRIYLR